MNIARSKQATPKQARHKLTRRKHAGLRRFGISLPLALLLFFVAACTDSGAPTSFFEEDSENPDATIPNATVQKNFMNGCLVSLDDSLQATNANNICECSYEKVLDAAADGEITFEKFKDVDDDLRSNINLLDRSSNEETVNQIRGFIRECITETS